MIFALISCFPVSLKKISISKIEIQLLEKNNLEKKEVIIPGIKYYAVITIITNDEKKIRNPYLDDLIFFSPNSSIKYSFDVLGNVILSFKNDYLFALYEDYTLILKSKYNQSNEYKFVWSVDWYNLPHLIFKGKDGLDGFHGTDGSKGEDGTSSSPNGKNGENGSDGGDGEDGENGQDVFLDMAYYRLPRKISGYNNDYLIIVSDVLSDKIYFFAPTGNINIDTSGGDGGDAGAPGKGGSGGKGYNGSPDGLNGIDGKPGKPGNGGKAGDIHIRCPENFPIFQYFNLIIEGGKAGAYFFVNILSAIVNTIFDEISKNVHDGQNGKIYITVDFIDNLFNSVNNKYFNRSNLLEKIENIGEYYD